MNKLTKDDWFAIVFVAIIIAIEVFLYFEYQRYN